MNNLLALILFSALSLASQALDAEDLCAYRDGTFAKALADVKLTLINKRRNHLF